MEEFAKYILGEEDLVSKIEIIYFLAQKLEINFDKSIIFKTEIARMFLKCMKIDVDHNLVLTACLLCNCKKVDDAQKIGKLRTYAKDGALHLVKLGFDERFCKICEGVNRYSGLKIREPESDILELVDNFGGLLIDRPERIGFNPDEAMVLIKYRNLKNENNRYIEDFLRFVEMMEKVEITGVVKTTAFARLQKLMRESKNITEFTKKIALEYSPNVDAKLDEIEGVVLESRNQVSRALFTPDSEEKILKNVKK